ncbi:hypothetical protein [Tsuneonella deserti]|nr:hypothetical protein [Tsuneonella deserti]
MPGEGASTVRLAGHSIAWHQVQAALALACERVVCLADRPGPELALVQREAERRGVSFHGTGSHRALSGLVKAADTLIVFAPGILPDREWLAQAFGGRVGVAVLSSEGAVERGFERIDRERAWAGVLATRGDAVEALGALPPDADPIAGLLRVSLQRGASGIAVPDKWLDEDRWALVGSPAAAERYEVHWYQRHAPPPPPHVPGAALAHRFARWLAGRVGDARRARIALAASGVAAGIAGATAGFLGQTTAAMTGLTAASLLLAIAAALGRLSRAGTGEPARDRWEEQRRAFLDLSLVAVATSPRTFEGWTTAFAALVLVAAIRLAAEPSSPLFLRPMSDRTLMLALLTIAAAGELFAPAMALLALLALALRIFWPHQKKLTPA